MRWSFKFSLVVIPFLVIGVLFAFAFQSFKPYPYDFTLAGGETRAIEIPPRFTTVNIDTSASDIVAHFFMETPPNDNITETNSIQTDLVVLGNYTYCRAFLTENAWMHVQWNTTGTQFDLRIIESERYFRNFISGEGYYDFEYSDDKIATSGARNTTADGPYTYYYLFRNTDVDGSITLNMTVHRMNYNLTGALDTYSAPGLVVLEPVHYKVVVLSKDDADVVDVSVALSRTENEKILWYSLLSVALGGYVVILIYIFIRKKQH